ncbi:MAG: hypothetical protein WBA43_16175 [Elainellaceae cyanobacterium]
MKSLLILRLLTEILPEAIARMLGLGLPTVLQAPTLDSTSSSGGARMV